MSNTLSPGGYVRQGQRGTSPPRSVNVQVAVRCRPLNGRERSHGERSIISCEEDRREVFLNASSAPRKPLPTSSSASTSLSGKRTFTYDHVFGTSATQGEVYNRLVEPIVDEVLQGYNCTVFAYGQTGTGKTHTMEGCRQENDTNVADRRLAENAGIIPRAVKQVFDHLRSLTDEHSVRVSHLELYNEQLTDLLSPDDFTTDSLRVYEDPQKGTFVQGLEDIVVRSEEEIFAILDKSAVKRKTAETLMNKYSSRSHSIFSITIHIKESTPDGADLLKVGKLNLVDLAGSENVGRSGAVKGRAREAGNINQSLLTLGRVITALVDRHPHVPYRDSKLTRLLQESLGGRNKTCIIATITPGSSSVEETASTLDYAYRAKSIKNRPTVNQMIAKHVLLKEYTEEIAKLKRELDATREKNGVYLLPDEYEQMQRLTQSQSSHISDLQEKSEEYEAKMSSLRGKLEKVQSALQRDQKILEETRKTLFCVTEDLKQTQYKLTVTTRERDESLFLMRSHETTENQLFKQGQDLQGTLSTSISDVSSLHERVDFKSNLEIENVRDLAKLKSSISQQVSVISKRLMDHRAIQDDIANSSTKLLDKAKIDLSTGLELAMSQLKELQESLITHDEDFERAAHKRELNFVERCRGSTFDVRRQLLLHGNTVSEKKASIEAACHTVRGVLEESAACLSDVMASFEGHQKAERERLDSLLHQQRSVFSNVEEQITDLVGKQRDISDRMVTNYQQGHNDQVEALKFSKRAIIERISSVMDELIGSSVTKGIANQDEGRKLAEEMMRAGEATNITLQTTHDALTAYTSDVVNSFTKATDKLSSSLNDTCTKQAESLKHGRERVDGVEAVAGGINESYCDVRDQCEKSLRDMDLNIDSFGASQQTSRQKHNVCQKETVDSFLDKVDNSRSAIREASWATCEEAAQKARYGNEALKELTTFLEEKLSHDVERSVQRHILHLDQDASKVPPKRQWPTRAVLAKTRDHDELLTEFRGNATTERGNESDARDELFDTKDDTMSDAEKESRSSLKGKQSWFGCEETESCRESSDVEDEKESVKDTTEGSLERSKSRRRVGSLDGSESAESEQSSDARLQDKKTKTGSDVSVGPNVVLSDVSNRRIVRQRSVRRIEPVIRKQSNKSAIPAPRSRAVGRRVGIQPQQ